MDNSKSVRSTNDALASAKMIRPVVQIFIAIFKNYKSSSKTTPKGTFR